MTILDTSVISELMQPAPQRSVVKWLDGRANHSVWTTTINVFEIRLGLKIMPRGKKRRELETEFDALLSQDIEDRVYGFDLLAASESAVIAATGRAAGRTIEIRDLLIAGIVSARRATLATRNTKHFEAVGIEVVNPWTA